MHHERSGSAAIETPLMHGHHQHVTIGQPADARGISRQAEHLDHGANRRQTAHQSIVLIRKPQIPLAPARPLRKCKTAGQRSCLVVHVQLPFSTAASKSIELRNTLAHCELRRVAPSRPPRPSISSHGYNEPLGSRKRTKFPRCSRLEGAPLVRTIAAQQRFDAARQAGAVSVRRHRINRPKAAQSPPCSNIASEPYCHCCCCASRC